MKVIILNGSPKGDKSITLKYIEYIKKNFPGYEYITYNVAKEIKKIEKDPVYFNKILKDVESSDLVLWSFPLYFMLVSSQYKRFIELIFEKKAEKRFKNKYSAAISTSINFFDNTAHDYIASISDDLLMHYIDFYSANMESLFDKKKRENFLQFARNVFYAVENKIIFERNSAPIEYKWFSYVPGKSHEKIDLKNKKLVILSDVKKGDSNLKRMIETVQNSCTGNVEVYNLNDLEIKGGCLGCIKCGYDNTCVYTGKDQYIDFYNTKLKTADIIIFAGTIKDRYLSSKWKEFYDRSFFNTHQPSLEKKQIAFLICGPMGQLPGLKQILQAHSEVMNSNLNGFITDEPRDSAIINHSIKSMIKSLIKNSESDYIKPRTFLGIGGMKIFRDDIWGHLRFVFQADYKYYKKNGIYDFPQKDYKGRFQNFLMRTIMRVPPVRKDIYDNMVDYMIKPYDKVLDKE